MPALVLCGGRGTRLRTATEKPLVPVCDEPMFDRVVRALRASRVSTVYAVASPQTPETTARARELGLDVIDAPGDGYVDDLRHALDVVGDPALTVVSDLPHLAADHVDRALSAATAEQGRGERQEQTTSVTVCVPVARKRSLGVSVDTDFEHEGTRVAPAGLNVVGDAPAETMCIVDDKHLAVNVNHPSDLAIAESLCS
jgi:adenosylcobinamide-phosphate guanylyltransferase